MNHEMALLRRAFRMAAEHRGMADEQYAVAEACARALAASGGPFTVQSDPPEVTRYLRHGSAGDCVPEEIAMIRQTWTLRWGEEDIHSWVASNLAQKTGDAISPLLEPGHIKTLCREEVDLLDACGCRHAAEAAPPFPSMEQADGIGDLLARAERSAGPGPISHGPTGNLGI